MPTNLTIFQSAVANIKDTISGKVEYNSNQSLELVLNLLVEIAHYNVIWQADSIAEMMALSAADANFVQIQDTASGASSGIYSYRSTGVADGVNSFNATGGGIWKKANLPD